MRTKAPELLPAAQMNPYATHLPALAAAIYRTKGEEEPVLELGAGAYSTPVLHALLAVDRRKLVTVESSGPWAEAFCRYSSPLHEILIVEASRIPEVICSRSWSVALVDHKPPSRRGRSIELLASRAHFVVVHDADVDTPAWDEQGYGQAIKRYRYGVLWERQKPRTLVLSNVEPLALGT